MGNSQLNLQINAIAFADNNPSNNPMLRHFDLTYKLMGLPAKNPDQKPYTVAPNSSQTIYDGTRLTLIDGTTELDVTKPYLDKDVYRFAWNGNGTAPAFRTDRAAGIDGTTEFTITMNGPVATFTASAGPFVTTSIQVGDIFLVQNGSGCSAANQGRFIVIAKTATSVSVQNINGAAEVFTVADAEKILVFNNGGAANQAQIADKLRVSAGFSVASQAVYEITEVTPEWIEVAVSQPNGLPIEFAVIPGAAGFVIYKTVKQFVLIAAQQTVAVSFNDDNSNTVLVEPIETDNPERPGILLKNGSFYKLTIVNNGLNAANVIVATIE